MSEHAKTVDGINGVPTGLLVLSANVINAIPKETQIPPECVIRKGCSSRSLPPSVRIRNYIYNLLHDDRITTEFLTQNLCMRAYDH